MPLDQARRSGETTAGTQVRTREQDALWSLQGFRSEPRPPVDGVGAVSKIRSLHELSSVCPFGCQLRQDQRSAGQLGPEQGGQVRQRMSDLSYAGANRRVRERREETEGCEPYVPRSYRQAPSGSGQAGRPNKNRG